MFGELEPSGNTTGCSGMKDACLLLLFGVCSMFQALPISLELESKKASGGSQVVIVKGQIRLQYS